MEDLLNQMSTVLSAFNAGTLLGLIALVNVLTNLTKVPRVRDLVPPPARKWVALGLGLAGGVLAALADGKPWLASLLQGVIIGVGAIGTHEVTSPMLKKAHKANIGPVVAILFIFCQASLIIVCISSSGCAWWSKGGGDFVKDSVADCTKPEVKEVIQAVIPIALALVDKMTDQDGAVDWNAFAAKSKESGWNAGVCLFQSALTKFLARKPMSGPNPQPYMDVELQREQALEARAKAWPGLKTKTAEGVQ